MGHLSKRRRQAGPSIFTGKATMIRILLAEDDDVMRTYLTRALERSGYHVSSAATGREALDLVESGTFDLLLTDIVMPEMDGIELAQRAQAMTPAPKVMFITGFAAVALQASDTVPDARLLSKPFMYLVT